MDYPGRFVQLAVKLGNDECGHGLMHRVGWLASESRIQFVCEDDDACLSLWDEKAVIGGCAG